MKYRLPGGPPPPLHVYGKKTSSTTVVAMTARNVNTRRTSRRSSEISHNRITTTPGKKYGRKPEWRPIAKYSTLWTNRLLKSFSTFSASDSFVLMPTPR